MNQESKYASRSGYQSLDQGIETSSPQHKSFLKGKSVYSVTFLRSIYVITFLSCFVFCGYFLFRGLAPNELFSNNGMRRLVEANATSSCTVSKAPLMTAGGAAVGSALVLGGFLLIGLSPLGPIAGGLFAANMGAGLASGSIMAVTQAAAMTGGAYATGAAVGAAAGATAACA